MEEKGIEALSLRKVAARAGVSHTAPYRHFRDREAILAAIALQGFQKLIQMSQRRAEHKAGLARIKNLGESYVKFSIEHPGLVRVMFGPELPDKSMHTGLAEADTAAFEMIMQSIADCQTQGLIHSNAQPHAQALMLWSFLHGFAALLNQNQLDAWKGRSSGLALARRQFQIALEGLLN